MGKVIAFRPRPRAAPRPSGALQRDAEILFFLGVRYLRIDDAVASQITKSEPEYCGTPPGGGKRKRRVRA
ncbi:MAG: hypothetical protein FJX40_10360 [Alphaproteobacteria bacterium]|nr:hypothetical protein [Alphaproteobacteria bacterium]MBM3625792.1 hypothetical protein [Alphaproteobacteria bacterium]MBM3640172.1 hypothetical protein [Alphaproteobacteria bacterium]